MTTRSDRGVARRIYAMVASLLAGSLEYPSFSRAAINSSAVIAFIWFHVSCEKAMKAQRPVKAHPPGFLAGNRALERFDRKAR
jgi:hypothetical protein